MEELTGKNYQSHQNSNLSFVEGLNVITGTSTHGKSSIIRMIQWVIENRPLGDDFVSWFSGPKETTSVELSFDDCDVKKERKTGKNIYYLGKEVYEAFRTEVPEPIKDKINMSDINVQSQHQPYFLINDTSGEVARKMNEFVGLDIIDSTTKNIASFIKEVNRKITDLDERRIKLDNDLQKFAYIDDISTFIIELRLRVEHHKKTWQNQTSIGRLIESSREIEKETQQIKKIIELDVPVKRILSKIADREITHKHFLSLQSLTNTLRDVTEDREAEKEWLKINIPYSMIMRKVDESLEIDRKVKHLSNYVVELKKVGENLATETYGLEELKSDYLNLLQKHKLCPVCDTPMTDKLITKIKEKI